MDAVKTLNEILEKTAKKVNNDSLNKAVGALKYLFEDSKDTKLLAEFLSKFHYSICQSFFEEIAETMPDEITFSFALALVSDEQFNKGNPNHILYPKGFASVLALAKKEKFHAAFIVLSHILRQTEKAKGFPDGCKNSFKKYILDKSGVSDINKLVHKLDERVFEYNENDRRLLTRFLSSIDLNQVAQPQEQNVPSYAQKTSNCTLDSIYAMQQEMLSKLDQLIENRPPNDSPDRRELEFETVRTEIQEKDKQMRLLRADLAICEKNFEDSKEEMVDLTERLRTALQMDEIANNQKLKTLMNDISEALKYDYSDFIKSKELAYSQDLFEAYRSTLNRVFKLLRRFDIKCE